MVTRAELVPMVSALRTENAQLRVFIQNGALSGFDSIQFYIYKFIGPNHNKSHLEALYIVR